MERDGEKLLIAGAVLAISVAAGVWAEHWAGRDPLRCKESNRTTQTSSNSPSVASVETTYQAPNCAVPKSDKEDDLCQQRRMAQAAEESACIARWQFWIGLFGLGGLMATIIYAARNARAAVSAAEGADVALRITQRAYLGVEPQGIRKTRYNKIVGHFVIKNAGKLPARKVSWFVAMKNSRNNLLNDFPIPVDDFRGSGVITPGMEMPRGGAPMSHTSIMNVGPDKPLYLYVWGCVRYDDGFGKTRVTNFCHRYNCVMGNALGDPAIDARHARYHDHGNDAD